MMVKLLGRHFFLNLGKSLNEAVPRVASYGSEVNKSRELIYLFPLLCLCITKFFEERM